MKKSIMLCVAITFMTACIPLCMAADKNLTLIYTGNMWGKITPCPS